MANNTSKKETVTIYVGKNNAKVINVIDLFSNSPMDIKSVTFDKASKYADYIKALEKAVKELSNMDVSITVEDTYEMAIDTVITEIHKRKNDPVTEVPVVEVVVDVEAPVVETKEIKVIDTIKTIKIEEENKTMTNMMNKANEVKGNMEAAVKDMMGKFTNTCSVVKDTVKVKGGETKEEYVNRMEDSIDIVQGAFGEIIARMSMLTGFNQTKEAIYKIIDAGLYDCNDKKDLFRMAKKCRNLIDEEIEFIEAMGSEESIKSVVVLKALNGEGEERNRSIFEIFAGTCVWIGKRVARKFRQWFNIDDEKSFMGAICKKLSGVAGTLHAGGKIVLNTVGFVLSFAVAGVIKAVEIVKGLFSGIFAKAKNWVVDKYNKLTDKDTANDVEYFQEDEDEIERMQNA